MKTPSQIDWAMLAAYIDGEGCISIEQSGTRIKGKMYKNHVLRINVPNTDPRLSCWIKQTFGGRIVPRVRNNPKWKDSFEWNTQSTHAKRILEGCMPYFKLKRQQAEVGLAFQSTKRKSGGPTLGAEVLAHRSDLTSQIRVLNRKGKGPQSTEIIQ